jgi:hypothetical protein
MTTFWSLKPARAYTVRAGRSGVPLRLGGVVDPFATRPGQATPRHGPRDFASPVQRDSEYYAVT